MRPGHFHVRTSPHYRAPWLPTLIALVALLSPVNGLAQIESPTLTSTDWMNAVKQQIVKSEYQATLQKQDWKGRRFARPKWHFVNRAHGLRSYFDKNGWTLQSRSDDDSWRWIYAFKSICRNKQRCLKTDKDSQPSNVNNEIRIKRSDAVREWYHNSSAGIEQGFTISTRPDGHGKQVELVGQISGNLKPLQVTKQSIRFDIGQDQILNYGGIKVVDYTGKKLNSWLEYHQPTKTLKLIFNDHQAQYPVVVDPLTTTAGWTVESDQSSAQIGSSVATAGDVNGDGYSDVIVGAEWYDNGNSDEGAAFVYHGGPSGPSTTPDWTAEGEQNGANFGQSVFTAGDVNNDGYSDVLVGAHNYDNPDNSEGRAFLYLGSASGLLTTPSWTDEGDQADAQFGYSVATAGDVNGDGFSDILVGANYFDNGESNEGRAYLYLGGASGPSLTPDWTAEADQADSEFGLSLSGGDVNGDGFSDIIVGIPYYDNGSSDTGRLIAYYGSISGPSSTADWTVDSPQASSSLGRSVAFAGDVNGDGYGDVIAGAHMYDGGELDEGRTFLYRGGLSGLSTSASWTAESDQASARFGYFVSSAGDVNGDGYADVMVGANQYDDGQNDEGVVFVYHGSSSGLSASANWTSESNQADAQLGRAVALAGDVNGDGYSDVIIGAPFYDNPENEEGRAYIYNGSANGLSTTANWSEEPNQNEAKFGFSIATAGDVNGDGYLDVLIGAPGFDNGAADTGRAFIFHGSTTGPTTTADWTGIVTQGGAQFGYAVDAAGDTDSDGYGDIVVGAPFYSNGESNEGAAYIFRGSSSGVLSSPAWLEESDQAESRFGSAVSSAGDLNGDGYGDILVGAPYYSSGESNEGSAFAYFGSPDGMSTFINWSTQSNQSGALLGSSISLAGDVNRDGYSDIILGAPNFTNGETGEGRALLFLGGSSGPTNSPDWSEEPNQANAKFGAAVSSAGDVNNDSFSDIVVGAPGYTNSENGEGGAFVYYGSVSGPSVSPDWSGESNQANAAYGTSVASAGDVNGDGYSDLIVGAHLYTNGESEEGQALVYHGSSSGLNTSADWSVESDQSGAHLGFAVTGAGDVNGDGFNDVLVGAPDYTDGHSEEGLTQVYFGNEGLNSFAIAPLQLDSNGDPLQVYSLTKGSQFTISLFGRVKVGRTRARIVSEVKPLGQTFNNSGLTFSSFSLLDLSGSNISSTQSGLSLSTRYHWRARLQYLPLMDFSPWYSPSLNGRNENDLFAQLPATATPTLTPTQTQTQTQTPTATNTPGATSSPTAVVKATPTINTSLTSSPTVVQTLTPTFSTTQTTTPTYGIPSISPSATVTPLSPATHMSSPSPTPTDTLIPNQESRTITITVRDEDGIALANSLVYIFGVRSYLSNESGSVILEHSEQYKDLTIKAVKTGYRAPAVTASFDTNNSVLTVVAKRRKTGTLKRCRLKDIASKRLLADNGTIELTDLIQITLTSYLESAHLNQQLKSRIEKRLVRLDSIKVRLQKLAARRFPTIRRICPKRLKACRVEDYERAKDRYLGRLKAVKRLFDRAMNQSIRQGSITRDVSRNERRKTKKLYNASRQLVKYLRLKTSVCRGKKDVTF